MAETVVLRVRILKALQTLLETIDHAGFAIDMGDEDTEIPTFVGRVKRGRVVFGEGDPLPMLSILEVPIPLDQIRTHPDNVYSAGDWQLLIQGFAVDDKDNPTDPAHALMAAVKKVLADAKRDGAKDFKYLGFESAVTNMQIGAGVVRPPDEVSEKAYFWLDLTLAITEDLSNPFENG